MTDKEKYKAIEKELNDITADYYEVLNSLNISDELKVLLSDLHFFASSRTFREITNQSGLKHYPEIVRVEISHSQISRNIQILIESIIGVAVQETKCYSEQEKEKLINKLSIMDSLAKKFKVCLNTNVCILMTLPEIINDGAKLLLTWKRDLLVCREYSKENSSGHSVKDIEDMIQITDNAIEIHKNYKQPTRNKPKSASLYEFEDIFIPGFDYVEMIKLLKSYQYLNPNGTWRCKPKALLGLRDWLFINEVIIEDLRKKKTPVATILQIKFETNFTGMQRNGLPDAIDEYDNILGVLK